MNYFGHIAALKANFFSIWLKSYVHFENAIKFAKTIDEIVDNCVWTCCGSFCQLWQEYIWSAVNLLKIRTKISRITKKHDTQLNIFDINGILA